MVGLVNDESANILRPIKFQRYYFYRMCNASSRFREAVSKLQQVSIPDYALKRVFEWMLKSNSAYCYAYFLNHG